MLKWWLCLLVSVCMFLISGAVLAVEGNPVAGKKKAQACVACHGPGGHSTVPRYPILAGQHADYIVHALTAYQTGDRKSPIMQPMAAPLSEQDKEDLAAYFASQKGLTLPWDWDE